MFDFIHRKRRGISIFFLSIFSLQFFSGFFTGSAQLKASNDFAPFAPVGDGNLVNLFNGDLNYGIPVLQLPNGPYEPFSMQLNYNSNGGVDNESSWVGNGWTLSPGSIDRTVRGYPDEFNGNSNPSLPNKIIKIEKRLPNWYVEGEVNLGVDFFSQANIDKSKKESEQANSAGDSSKLSNVLSLSVDGSSKVRYSNQSGYIKTYMLGANLPGFGGASVNFSPSGTTFAFQPDLLSIAGKFGSDKSRTKTFLKGLRDVKQKYRLQSSLLGSGALHAMAGIGNSFSFAGAQKTTTSPRYSQNSFNLSLGGSFVGIPYVNIGLRAGVEGNFGVSWEGKDNQTVSYDVYGFKSTNRVGGDKVINDYMTERGSEFTQRDLFLGIPYNNYDLFSVSTQGIGGSFRWHKEKGGYYSPDAVTNTGTNVAAGIDINVGIAGAGIGVDLGVSGSVNKVKGDSKNVPAQLFSSSTGCYRFNNDPGGKVDHLQNPFHIPLARLVSNTLVPLPGLKSISPDYSQNQFNTQAVNLQGPGQVNLPNRANGIKQIVELPNFGGFKVVGADGKTYVFDKPVYHRNEVQVSVSCGELTANQSGLININLPLGRTGLANEQYRLDASGFSQASGEINPNVWAATYLLTRIEGPDYHKIGQKEYGNYVKFTYRGKYVFTGTNRQQGTYYRERTPKVGMNYSHGKIANKRDQMASMSSVEKEVYYLEKIETSTHEAFFVTNKYLPPCNLVPSYRFKYCMTTRLFYDAKLIKDTCVYTIQTSPDPITYDNNPIQYRNLLSFILADNACISNEDLLGFKDSLGGCPPNGYGYHIARGFAFSHSFEPIPVDYRCLYLQGSNQNRQDGLSAGPCNSVSDPNSIQTNLNLGLNNQIEFLEKIVVFSKTKDPFSKDIKPDQTTFFEYDYSTWPGQPNSAASNGGRLTLRKVWTEGEGLAKGKISPYVFQYQYKPLSDYSAATKAVYGPILPATNLNQSPGWSPNMGDGWGNLSAFGPFLGRRLAEHQYQGNNLAEKPGFQNLIPSGYIKPDPAAYRLKQIQLPGGGEILVDYEENEYQYVQNRRAMGLANVIEAGNEMDGGRYSRTPFYIVDPRDLGLEKVNSNTGGNYQELERQVAVINDFFKDRPGLGAEMVYYKFLYRLRNLGSENQSIDPFGKQVEWIDGYSKFDGAEIIQKPGYGYCIKVKLKADNAGRPNIPRTACYEYFANTRYQMETGPESIGDAENYINSKYTTWQKDLISTSAADRLKARLLGVVPLMVWMVGKNIPGSVQIPNFDEVGIGFNKDLSWLRLPMLKPKKGGGVRVKKILYYDAGMENEAGTAMFYGKEYHYGTPEILPTYGTPAVSSIRMVSSGVASNEPGELRPENPFTTYLPKKSQTWLQRVLVGENKDQSEGPIGEMIMPPPSVGYSRVIAQDINTQAHGTGYTCHEFITYKDFPVDAVYSAIGQDTSEIKTSGERGIAFTSLDDQKEKDRFNIGAGGGAGIVSFGFNYSMAKYWASQGFRVIQHDLNGKPRRNASYAGVYERSLMAVNNMLTSQRLPGELESDEITHYSRPGELLPVVRDYKTGKVEYDIPGKETDVALETRAIEDNNMNLGVSFDLNFWVLPINPTMSLGLSIGISENSLFSYSASNVIRYPSFVKSVESYKDGIKSRQDFLIHDYHTGQALVTRSFDHFDKAVYQVNVPAYWKYETMGPWYLQNSGSSQVQETQQMAEQLTFYDFEPFERYQSGKKLIKGILKPVQNWENMVSQSSTVFGQPSHASSEVNTLIAANEGLSSSNGLLKPNRLLPIASYAYKAPTFLSNLPGEALKGGLIKGAYQRFDFSNVPSNYPGGNWIMTDSSTVWHPSGIPLEKANALKEYSSTDVSSDIYMKKSSSAFARYGQNLFEDFEDVANALDSNAHTGTKSILASFAGGSQWLTLSQKSFINPGNIGYLVRFWAKRIDQESNHNPPQIRFSQNGTGQTGVTQGCTKIATCEDWELYEASNLSSGLTGLNRLEISGTTGQMFVVDDVKIQRMDSEMSCEVLDRAGLKVLASFDENHFALVNQYDAEGRLIRKLKETERGRFTLEEKILNTPEKPRF